MPTPKGMPGGVHITAWAPATDEQVGFRWDVRQLLPLPVSPEGKLSVTGQKCLRYGQNRFVSHWRAALSKSSRQYALLLVSAALLAALMLGSWGVLSAALSQGRSQLSASGLGSRRMLGFPLRVSPGVAASFSDGGGGGGAAGALSINLPETAPGFYVQNLTAGVTDPAQAKRPPAMVLRYEACGGLFNQYYCHLNAFAMGVALGVDAIIMPHAKRRRKFTAGNTTWEGVGADTLWDLGAIRSYAAGKNMSVAMVPTILPNYVIDGFGGFNPFGLRRQAVVNFPHMGSELWRMDTFVAAALKRVAAHREFLTEGPTGRSQTGLRWREVDGLFTVDGQPRVPHWARIVDPEYHRDAWQNSSTAPDVRWADDRRLAGENASWGEGSQVWELFGRFLANETFASEMDISLAPLDEAAIPHVDSNPKLRDGFQKPVEVDGQKLYRLGDAPERVLLNLPCVMHSIQALGSPLMTEVALNWGFAARAQQLADKVIVGMAKWSGFRGGEGFAFNGIHLRLEADASRWIAANGGLEAMWDSYLDACQEAGINSSLPLFVASGIWSAMTPVHAAGVKRLQAQAASRLFKASDFLSKADLKELHSEQRSLVDFLVVVRSQRFVGVDSSTFSVAVQQHRKLRGVPAEEAGLLVRIKGLPDFHREMMRLGSTFSDYPRSSGAEAAAAAAQAQLPAVDAQR